MLRLTVAGLLLAAFVLAPAMPVVADNHNHKHCHISLTDPTRPGIYGDCIPVDIDPSSQSSVDSLLMGEASFSVDVPAIVSCGEAPCDEEETYTLILQTNTAQPMGTTVSLTYDDGEESWMLTFEPKSPAFHAF